MSNEVLKVFPDTPMYYGITGLMAILSKHKIKATKRGQFYVFINRDMSAFKLVTGEDKEFIVVHYKSPSRSRPISIDAIRYVPRFFGGEENDAGYSKALDHVLRKKCPQLFDEVG